MSIYEATGRGRKRAAQATVGGRERVAQGLEGLGDKERAAQGEERAARGRGHVSHVTVTHFGAGSWRHREGSASDWQGQRGQQRRLAGAERAAWGLEGKEGGRRREGRAGQRAYALCITVTCLIAVGRGRKRATQVTGGGRERAARDLGGRETAQDRRYALHVMRYSNTLHAASGASQWRSAQGTGTRGCGMGQSERAAQVGGQRGPGSKERAGELREATPGEGYAYSKAPLLARRGGGARRAGHGDTR